MWKKNLEAGLVSGKCWQNQDILESSSRILSNKGHFQKQERDVLFIELVSSNLSFKEFIICFVNIVTNVLKSVVKEYRI